MSTVELEYLGHAIMKFFIPNIPDSRCAEMLYRQVTSHIEDIAGWKVTAERVFSIEFQDGNEVRSAIVGGEFAGQPIDCIFSTDLVFLIVSVRGGIGGSMLELPTIVDKRSVLNVRWFEGFAPKRESDGQPVDLSEMPEGTVTFLFTDIEGSTALWEKHQSEMPEVLARHDWLIQEAVESNGGFVFKTVGDSLCAAFPTAPGALRAALEAQLDLESETWPDGISINVRMAIHAGIAIVRNGDYFGKPLSLVSRMLSVCHGGQILLSEVTRNLCRDHLPCHVHMKLLGEFSLRGLGRPEALFQLSHPYVHRDYPPLKQFVVTAHRSMAQAA